VHPSLLLVLLDCITSWAVPSLRDMLPLMDAHHPVVGWRYTNLYKELAEMGIKDAVDLYSYQVKHLATFGWLRQDSAHHLHDFCRDKFLIPLGFVEESDSDKDTVTYNSPLTQQMEVSDLEEDQIIKDEADEMILEWLDGVGVHEEVDQLSARTVEVDDGEDDSDMATSQEV